ncbi:MAG TPA: tripartite tricarboxylate transporter substrate binding protein [Acidobacteriaceae bacterium]|nr:tripartite tricarboxylate transporter substrate binding protein [Acidobacteriaceae bacterium]
MLTASSSFNAPTTSISHGTSWMRPLLTSSQSTPEIKRGKTMRRSLVIICAVLLLVGVTSARAAEDAYPSRSIRIVVPFAPGGSTDILIRPIAQQMSLILGVPVIVDNRGGAGGNIGAELVAKATPDGYTLMVTTSGVMVANKSLYASLPYDPATDFAPVSVLASLPNVLVVNPSGPYKSVQDLVAAAKKSPGTLTFASGGTGTSNHLAGELFKSSAGIDLTHVPYRGGGPAVIAVLGGQVTMLFATLPSAMSQVQAGKLRALAVTSLKRAPSAPDVPTMIEQGIQGFDVSIWIGALAPRGTPPAIIEKLNKAFVGALDAPEVRTKLTAEGYEKVGSTPAQMAETIRSESAKWDRVIKAAHITAQ